jgi:hypothetical protein
MKRAAVLHRQFRGVRIRQVGKESVVSVNYFHFGKMQSGKIKISARVFAHNDQGDIFFSFRLSKWLKIIVSQGFFA